jgi:hypothetical protein
MKVTTVLVLAMAGLIAVESSPAQDWRGFVTGGAGSVDQGLARETIGQVSTGVLVGLGTSRVRAGGQFDLLLSGGYASARGGVLAEADVIAGRIVRPIVNGGRFWADGGGLWVLGGGLDTMIDRRFGIRVFVQDAFRTSRGGSMSRTIHEPAVQVGLVWR